MSTTMVSNLAFDRTWNSWRGGGVYIKGARAGTIAQLFIYGNSVACAVVDYNGWARFFRGSPILQTEGAAISINQLGLIGSPVFEGLHRPILNDMSRVPVHTYSQLRKRNNGPKCDNEILYANDPSGSLGAARWTGNNEERIRMSRL